jgi:hypothetical protein
MAFIGIVSANAQIVWGGRVGACYSTISDDAGSMEFSGDAGLEVGPVLYYALKDNIYINSGAMFSVKSFTEGSGDHTDNLSLYYLEVPLYIGYAFPIGGLDFYGQAGPYVGFKVSESLPKSWGDESGLKVFNAGLGFVGGVNIKKFKLEIGYQNGLTNLLDFEGDDYDDYKLTLGSMFFGVSYIF